MLFLRLFVGCCGELLAQIKRGKIRLFSPSLIVFHFCKGFDFHVDGAVLITAGNCPGEMRQSDEIRRADPHPDKKDKEESHHPHMAVNLHSIRRLPQSKFSSLHPGKWLVISQRSGGQLMAALVWELINNSSWLQWQQLWDRDPTCSRKHAHSTASVPRLEAR